MSQVPPPSTPPPPQPPPSGQPPAYAPHPLRVPPPGGLPAGSRDRVSTRGIWLGLTIMFGGFVLAVLIGVLGFVGLNNTVDDFTRASSGFAEVELDAGDYVVYNEGPVGFVEIDITAPDGTAVPVPSFRTISYSFGDNSGISIGNVELEQSGTYIVMANRDIAFGEYLGGSIARTILVPLAVGGLGFVIGLVLVVVTIARRSSTRSQPGLT